MSTAVIHLNDIGLMTSTDGEVIVEDAGLALLLEDGLKLGNEAAAIAKMHPRKVNDNYWQSPGIEPLKGVPGYLRHHADLIYHHLTSIHAALGTPDKIMLAVPSSMNAEQLSYILGVADALPFEFVGLCDLAVAGTADSGLRGKILHYDIQRHQTVITLLQADDNTEKSDVLVAPNLGLHAVENKWTSIIANNFIEQCRFDPMHTASSEQALYNQLPDWISQLTERNDLSIDFSTNERTYEAKIERQQLIDANDQMVQALLTKGQELAGDAQHHLASHRLEPLLALSSLADRFEILSARSVIRSLYEHSSEVQVENEQLPLVTRLANLTDPEHGRSSKISPTTASAVSNSSAVHNTTIESVISTHLLVDNTASPLPAAGAAIFLVIDNNHLITTSDPDDSLATIKHENNELVISSNDPTLRLNNKPLDAASATLESGDILSTAGGLSARVITVLS